MSSSYAHGLHDLGRGCYAYLQPDGTWGYSNAGLVTSGGQSLLVDTLMGVQRTRDMLDEMRRRVPAAARIETLVNTHANLDHTLGNQVLRGVEIVAARATADEIVQFDPGRLLGGGAQPDEAAEFFLETMGRKFDFSGFELTAPTRTFEAALSLSLGDKRIELVDLGPAHTNADTIVYVPSDRVVFTGDLLFNEVHPIMWAGPVSNWIRACDYILNLDVETVVPGHGPIAGKGAVANLKRYFEFMRAEARMRFDAGLGWEEAARDIALAEFSTWTDAERVVANVYALYRELDPRLPPGSMPQLFAAMQRFRKRAR